MYIHPHIISLQHLYPSSFILSRVTIWGAGPSALLWGGVDKERFFRRPLMDRVVANDTVIVDIKGKIIWVITKIVIIWLSWWSWFPNDIWFLCFFLPSLKKVYQWKKRSRIFPAHLAIYQEIYEGDIVMFPVTKPHYWALELVDFRWPGIELVREWGVNPLKRGSKKSVKTCLVKCGWKLKYLERKVECQIYIYIYNHIYIYMYTVWLGFQCESKDLQLRDVFSFHNPLYDASCLVATGLGIALCWMMSPPGQSTWSSTQAIFHCPLTCRD